MVWLHQRHWVSHTPHPGPGCHGGANTTNLGARRKNSVATDVAGGGWAWKGATKSLACTHGHLCVVRTLGGRGGSARRGGGGAPQEVPEKGKEKAYSTQCSQVVSYLTTNWAWLGLTSRIGRVRGYSQ